MSEPTGEQAHKPVAKNSDGFLRALVLMRIGDAFVDGGKDFKQARETAAEINDAYHRAMALEAIAEATGSNEDFNQAWQTAAEINDDYKRVLAREKISGAKIAAMESRRND